MGSIFLSMRSINYARQSKDKTKSIDEQAKEMLDDAVTEGDEVVREYSDGVSASRHTRKLRDDWLKLLEDIRNKQADVVRLWESSRGDRKLTTWSAFLDLCRETGTLVRVTSHGRTYDLSRARDWRTLAEDGVDSSYESDKLRERVLRGVEGAAKTGKPHGKVLFGYTRVYDDRGRYVEQVAHPEHSQTVQEAARRVYKGEACYAIAQDFNARQIAAPRGGRWDPTQIKRLVTNPGYVGKRVYRGEVIGDAQWPALIDQKTFDACVTRLSDPRRRSVEDLTVKHLLSGIAACDVCKTPLRRIKNRGYPSYQCPGGFCVSVNMAKLEGYIEDVIVERLAKPDFLELFAPKENPEEREQAEATIAELEGEIESGKTLVRKRKMTMASFAELESDLLRQIDALRRILKPVAVPPVVRKAAGSDAKARWARLTLQERRELVTILVQIYVRKTGQGSRRFDPQRVRVVWR